MGSSIFQQLLMPLNKLFNALLILAWMKGISILYLFWYLFSFVYATQAKHVLVIIADDFGWADVSFHNTGGIQTPNIDRLVGGGLELTNYYTQHICTPTRSALLTGRYPIHTGLQESFLKYTNSPQLLSQIIHKIFFLYKLAKRLMLLQFLSRVDCKETKCYYRSI